MIENYTLECRLSKAETVVTTQNDTKTVSKHLIMCDLLYISENETKNTSINLWLKTHTNENSLYICYPKQLMETLIVCSFVILNSWWKLNYDIFGIEIVI